jgi:hypothetical protein
MTSIPRLSIERRAESHQERRYRHGDKSPKTFRFAGEVFNTEPKEKRRSLQKAERQRLQASRPVGLGFGERTTVQTKTGIPKILLSINPSQTTIKSDKLL